MFQQLKSLVRKSGMLMLGAAFVVNSGTDASAADKLDFVKDIKPIFEAHCYKCHGIKKAKAKLRLDRKDGGSFKGDKEDWLVIPGNAEESFLYEMIMLPADDSDVMPPEGEKPMSKEAKQKIHDWIKQGAQWPESADAPLKMEGPKDALKSIELTDAQQKAEAKALDALKAKGALAMRVAANVNVVDVNFSLVGKDVADGDVKLLNGLEPTLVWLNLARTSVTDKGLAPVANFKGVRRLHLENTAVTDAGLKHLAGLGELRYLNLYGTGVTDAGLASLAGLSKLEKLYLWQTKVTDKGVADLKKKLPELYVNTGANLKPVAPPKPKEEKVTIASIMQKAHKSKLHEKVLGGKANDAEIKQLLGFYQELAKQKCPKGNGKSWTDKTTALVKAAEAVVKAKTDKKALDSLKAATNCKACHDAHK